MTPAKTRRPRIPMRLIPSHLRRRPSREVIETVLARACELDPADFAALRAMLEGQVGAAAVGGLAGVNEHSVRRRLNRLVQLLLAPEFEFVRGARAHWHPARSRVATAVFLKGRSMREASAEHGLPLHVVRKHVLAVRAQMEASAGKPGGKS